MIEIVADSVIDHRDSAFPTVIQMDNGDLVCGFSVSGGPEVTGGTDFARSSDQGETWRTEGTVLPAVPVENGRLVNTLRLSRTPDNRIIAYGQVHRLIGEKTTFGQLENYAVWTRTSPGAFDFAPPVQLPKGKSHNLEVSNPIVVTDDGRFLAPAAYLPAGRFGEEVIVRESVDGGENWNGEYTVFADPERKKGFFEQKIINAGKDRLLAMAWTVTLGDYNDLNNHYTFSNDGGRTWMPPRELPFTGQTMSPLFLGEGRFLVVYNYRRAPQGIHLAMIHLNEDRCKVDFDEILWRPSKNVPGGKKKGVDSFDEFQFGLPSLFRLGETSFLLLFWHYWDHAFGIRCLKLEIEL